MSISVTGKLNRAANQFQAGDGKGFGVRVGVRFWNRETSANEYTNYEAVVFAKEGAQSSFYESALQEGTIIEISGHGCQIKTFEGSSGPVHSISILGAKLGYIGASQPQAEFSTAPATPSAPQEEFQDIPF